MQGGFSPLTSYMDEGDYKSVVNDLKLLCNIKQTNYKSRNLYEVRIPAALLNHIVQLDGLIVGKKIIHPGTLPEFILEPNCPLPIVHCPLKIIHPFFSNFVQCLVL